MNINRKKLDDKGHKIYFVFMRYTRFLFEGDKLINQFLYLHPMLQWTSSIVMIEKKT